MINCLEITGTLFERSVMRFTPAGLPVLECLIEHLSCQQEAGHQRQITCRLPAIVLGDATRLLQAMELGTQFKASGFLANKSQNSRQIRLHITQITYLEGN